ncbi:sulfite exporter TauE/SafE family protein [Litorivivens sp.]|uniref:sulfite exporter TauE/SafE family protein n=2 Tax=Litorivivens sp. TaxID=2020868 RepID=UPI003562EDB6
MLALLFGVIVGLALGLTGGGGSLFAIPLLVYGLGYSMQQAVPMSLLIVGITSAVGVLAALPSKRISFKPALVFAVSGMLITPFGIQQAMRLPQALVLMLFAVLALLIASYMWRRSLRAPEEASVVRASFMRENATALCRFSADGCFRINGPCAAGLAVAGAATGFLSGLFGVGGGFLIVPALMMITQLSIQSAVATSLLTISAISSGGVVSSLVQGVHFDWATATPFIAGGIGGLSLGFAVAKHLSGAVLQRVFAGLIMVTAVFIILRTMHEGGML